MASRAGCSFRPSQPPWPSQMCAGCGEWRDDHALPIDMAGVGVLNPDGPPGADAHREQAETRVTSDEPGTDTRHDPHCPSDSVAEGVS